ncbi:hypothetical protein Trydic_g11389 [Trypoxylus dichotomus]
MENGIEPSPATNLDFFMMTVMVVLLTQGVISHRAICVNIVIQPMLIPLLQQLVDRSFQQDNTRPYITKATLEFLENANVDRLLWPSHLPDSSPIEHVRYGRVEDQ